MSEAETKPVGTRPKGSGRKKGVRAVRHTKERTQNQPYTDAEKAAALSFCDFAMAENPKLTATDCAKMIKVPARTLSSWLAGDRPVSPIVNKMRASHMDSMINRTSAAIEMILSTMVLVAHKASYRDLTMGAAILTDKIPIMQNIRDRVEPPAARPEEKPPEPVVIENPYEKMVETILQTAKLKEIEMTREEAVQKIIEARPEAKTFLMPDEPDAERVM